MNKLALRKRYTEKRQTLSQDEVLSLSEKIFENFVSRFQVVENQSVNCFLSIVEKSELDTKFFLNYFFEKKIRVFVPKIYKGKLISIEIQKDTVFIKNSWGVPEPESNQPSDFKDFDFILTPLLCCDNQGNRVGYGKGFYDDFFKNINSNAVKVGLNFFSPEEKIDDVSENDIPLDYLVTPTEVLSFGGVTSKSTK